MDNRTGNILTFTRRPINEWPKSVYLADLGDGEGCRPYSHIQRPDDTTPEYVRYDLYFAAVAERDKLRRENEALRGQAAQARKEARIAELEKLLEDAAQAVEWAARRIEGKSQTVLMEKWASEYRAALSKERDHPKPEGER